MSPDRSSRSVWWLAFLGLIALAACLRFWALDFGLPHLLTRPDEEVVLFQTRFPASGTFDLGHDVYQYNVYSSAYVFLSWAWAEVGHGLLRALGLHPDLGFVALLDAEPWRILLVLRTLSALAGVLCVVLVVHFTHRELSLAEALLAGALLATSFVHVRDSHAAKPDVLMTLGVVAALGVMAPLGRRLSYPRAIATGALIGVATAMKYPAVLLLASAAVLCVLALPAAGGRRAGATALVIGVSAALAFVVSAPDVLLDPRKRALAGSIAVLVFPGLFPEAATTSSPAPSVPSTLVDFQHPTSAWEGWRYYYGFALRYGMGLAACLAAPAALVWGILARRPLALAAAVFAGTSFLLLGVSPAVHTRYLTPLAPALSILLAGAAAAAARRVAPRRAGVLLAVAGIALVAEPLWRSIQHDRLLARTDTRLLATAWLREHVPPGSHLAIHGTVFWGWGEPQMPAGVELVRADLDPAALDAAGVRWIVTHDHVLFSSRVDEGKLARLGDRLALRADLDPFQGPRDQALYDPQDAYYTPLAGFPSVSRPGPRIRIYELRPPRAMQKRAQRKE